MCCYHPLPWEHLQRYPHESPLSFWPCQPYPWKWWRWGTALWAIAAFSCPSPPWIASQTQGVDLWVQKKSIHRPKWNTHGANMVIQEWCYAVFQQNSLWLAQLQAWTAGKHSCNFARTISAVAMPVQMEPTLTFPCLCCAMFCIALWYFCWTRTNAGYLLKWNSLTKSFTYSWVYNATNLPRVLCKIFVDPVDPKYWGLRSEMARIRI